MAESMKDYETELEASFKKIEEGDILTGTVISVDEKEVVVDLKYYAEGIIPAEDYSREPGFSLKEQVNVGDEVSATVVSKDDGNGNILLSRTEAADVLAWDKLKELKDSKEVIDVVVKGIVNGGVIAYVEGVKMEYTEKDLVKIAKRDNNTKRNYLVVDPLQGKHIPVVPSKALDLFAALADTFREKYKDEKLLLVGFAETATAIGAQAAITVGADYIQTTREVIPGVNYLFVSEDLSHATEQKLVKDDIDRAAAETDRIIFIEDEVTTGKTIRNIISILDREYDGKFKYSVASLLNGMSEENLERYKRQGISLYYLVKTDHSTYGDRAETFKGDGFYYKCPDKAAEYTTIYVKDRMDARRLIDSGKYEEACESLWREIREKTGNMADNISGKRILVIGTEEFMFPALYIG